jgi:hypothetical protein
MGRAVRLEARILKDDDNHRPFPLWSWHQHGLSVLLPFEYCCHLSPTSAERPTLLYFWLACHAALDAASSICFSGFLLLQE